MVRDVGLPYKLPDAHSRNEKRHFEFWLEEISQRAPHILGVDLRSESDYGPSCGDPVRTTGLWAELNQVPVQYAIVSKIAYTKTGKRMAFLYPRGPSLLPVTGLWLPADDVEADDA